VDDARRDQPAHQPHQIGQMVRLRALSQPGLLAKITANIDVISAGGSFWESARAGTSTNSRATHDFRKPADRIRVLRDRRNRQGAVVGTGRHLSRDATSRSREPSANPKPVQQPHPEILIGGGGEQLTLRVVAQHADTANFGGKPHEWQHKADVLASTAGHRPRLRRDP